MSLANTHLWNGVDPDSSDPIPVPLDTPDALLDLRNLAPASFASAPSVGSTVSFGAVAASTPATLNDAVVMSETDGGTIVLQTATITGSNPELFEVVGGFSSTRYDIDSEQPAYDLRFLGAPAPGTYTAELKFTMRDTYFNALPDATYSLSVVVVPEPSSTALAAIALAAVASLAWRRRIT